MSQSAVKRVASLLDAIQVLYAEAVEIATLNDIPFEIELDGGQLYNTTVQFEPSGWESSSYHC